MALSAPHTPALEDEDLERMRLEHEDKIVELQKLPASSLRVIANVTLADGILTPIPHGLGRAVYVLVSPPRGATSSGRIEEVRDGTYDRTKYVALKATGWGATITVDVWVL